MRLTSQRMLNDSQKRFVLFGFFFKDSWKRKGKDNIINRRQPTFHFLGKHGKGGRVEAAFCR